MPDVNVNRWKQTGRLYCWRYTENARNYPGWQMTAEADFIDGFVDLAARMLAAPYHSSQTLAVTPPTAAVLAVPNNRGGRARWRSPRRIRLVLHRDGAPEIFRLADDATLEIVLGPENLLALRDCVRQIAKGKIDYAIELGGEQLWFW